MKIGVMTPTYNRPDFIRGLVLQMMVQTKPIDLLAIHHNGNKEDYQWAIADLKPLFKIIWIHTPEIIKQDKWYSIPLQVLISNDCTHFFWCDHDDIYYCNHVETCIENLLDHDFVVNRFCDLLVVKKEFSYQHKMLFTSHAPGGMSSSMAFNRVFAIALYRDLESNRMHGYSDNVVKFITMPKFKCKISDSLTTGYVSHPMAYSSSGWGTSK